MNKDTHSQASLFMARLQGAWLSLDFVLRLALIRKRGLSLNTPQSERVFAIRPHHVLIQKLLDAYSAAHPQLVQQLMKITGPEGIRDQYRRFIYTLWTLDPSCGGRIRDRIGQDEWRNPIPCTPPQIETLIADIENTAYTIEALTKLQP